MTDLDGGRAGVQVRAAALHLRLRGRRPDFRRASGALVAVRRIELPMRVTSSPDRAGIASLARERFGRPPPGDGNS